MSMVYCNNDTCSQYKIVKDNPAEIPPDLIICGACAIVVLPTPEGDFEPGDRI